MAELATLGASGWELVTVSPQAGHHGAAGLTTDEVWVFKRPSP